MVSFTPAVVSKRLISKLQDISVVDCEVTLETRVFTDLKISGSDLWDLLDWVTEEFGTDFSTMDVSHFGPGEGFDIDWLIQKRLFRKPYPELYVRSLINAAVTGHWVKEA